jgi:hypothetical protein
MARKSTIKAKEPVTKKEEARKKGKRKAAMAIVAKKGA